jgi:hypothetical protein
MPPTRLCLAECCRPNPVDLYVAIRNALAEGAGGRRGESGRDGPDLMPAAAGSDEVRLAARSVEENEADLAAFLRCACRHRCRGSGEAKR